MQKTDLKGFQLSLQQTRLWTHQGQDLVYYTRSAVSIDGQLNTALFLQALQQIVAQHEILRTTFYISPGMEVPMQVIQPDYQVCCPIIQLAPHETLHRDALIQHYVADIQQPGIDLARGPLFQAQLLRITPQEHILLLSIPTLCGDTFTHKQIVTDILRMYAHIQHGEKLEEEPLQYVDVSNWQNELLQEDDATEQQAYWDRFDLAQIASAPVPFSQHYQGTDTQAFSPQSISIPVDTTVTRQLLALAERYAVTGEVVLLTCWQTLLWRLTNASPYLHGIACSGRDYEELQTAVGAYARLVPFGIELSGQHSVDQSLMLVKAALQEARDAQFYFNAPTEQTGFPVQFEFDDWSSVNASRDLQATLLHQASLSEPFLLKLNSIQTEAALYLTLHFDATSISAGHASEIGHVFSRLLEQVSAGASIKSGQLALVTENEAARLQQLFTGPQSPMQTHNLIQHFEAYAARHPDQTALVCGPEKLSYRQLNERANQLAHRLIASGITANSLVALYLERSISMLVGMLATLKAGGAYVPLDAEQPASRIAWQLQDTAASVILTQSGVLQERLTGAPGALIMLDDPREGLEQEATTNPGIVNDLQDLAYIIYTSGSTGRPKGVMLRHAGVNNYIQSLSQFIASEPGLHFASVSTLAADLGNTVIFCSLASGGCLHLITYETFTSSAAFGNYMSQQRIDVLKIVPSHLSSLLSTAESRQILPQRHLVLGGEVFPRSLLQRLQALDYSGTITNHYGPTETTIGALTYRVDSSALAGHSTVPVGCPITNTEVYLLDQSAQIVPLGIAGELYIGGAGVAAGYLNQPALTDERFIPHPFKDGARLYRTGDLVRADENGIIEYLGRIDNQVKIRGYRVEIGEIEAALRQLPEVHECVVLAQEDQRLVAYVVPRKQTHTPSTQLLRQALEQQLPAYMLPATFVYLRSLPLTANGKLDRHKLADLQIAEEQKTAYVAPSTLVEELLVSIWESLLNVQHIGVNDHFVDLGGHSLLATQIVSRIRTILQVEIPLRVIFEQPTIASIARYIAQTSQSSHPQTIQLRDRQQPPVLSFGQQRLWFLNQLQPKSTAYTLSKAIRLQGDLNIQVLEQSFAALIARHETLRTCFQVQDTQPVQIITEPGQPAMSYLDISTEASEQREVSIQAILQQEQQRPFDLAQGPLLRIMLIRVAEQEHVLCLNMHHSISDGWSNTILVQEMATLYNAFHQQTVAELAKLPIQYADFAVWQRQVLAQSEFYQEQMRYWVQQLQHLEPLQLPTDRPRPATQTFCGDQRQIKISSQLRERLNQLCQQEGVTQFMALLAAFQVLLAHYSGQSDIAVGTPIANRTRTEIEGLIGFFANTLVIRTDLSGAMTFKQLLKQVSEKALQAYAHQDLPFEKLVEELHPERDLSRFPLFQVAFSLQKALDAESYTLQQLQISPVEIENSTMAKFDLTLVVTDTEQTLDCLLEYNTDLFDTTTIERMLDHWLLVLEALTTDVEQPIKEISLLSVQEKSLVLEQWNTTETDYSGYGDSLQQLIEQQCTHDPDRIAVTFEQQQLSYGELERRSNQLAHFLHAQGIGPDRLVGLCLQRSLELVIAIIAILKAGGAYVPLDPDYPTERLRFLIEDTHLSFVLTQHPLLPLLPSSDCRRLCLDRDWILIAGESDAPLPTLVHPEQLAYMIYTSGSTGLPKGAMNTQQALLNRLLWMQQRYQLDATDCVLQKTPFSFDVSVWEFFWPLLAGARLLLAAPEGQRDSAYLVALIRQQAVSLCHFVPSMLSVFLQEPEVSHCQSLRDVICSGEALSFELQQRFFARLGAGLHNLYGPTEAAIDVTAWTCQPESLRREVPIGRPIANLRVYVLDERLRPLPIGVPGELYLGGIGLARGYAERPALTAERFVPDPLSQQPGARLYRTGDRVRWLEDGTLSYLGRLDFQVKIRGQRIELGEIETILSHHSAIRDAVVTTQPDSQHNPQLIAYLVPDREAAHPLFYLLHLQNAGLISARQQYELPNGMTIVSQNKNETEFLYREIFEDNTYASNGIQLPANSCVFDIGANIGLFSLFIGQQCPDARIYAFEPIPPLHQIAQLNADIYRLQATIFEQGLADAKMSVPLTYYPHISIMSGQYADVDEERAVVASFLRQLPETGGLTPQELDELISERLTSETIQCTMTTLSDVIAQQQIAQIDLLKIDVEKGELAVLKGIQNEDWPKIQQIVMEVHDLEGRLQACTQLLQAQGYQLAIEKERYLTATDLYTIYARRSPTIAAHLEAEHGHTWGWSSAQALQREIRSYLNGKLPAALHPTRWVWLEELPLTHNGKLDRKALPAPSTMAREKGSQTVPRTPLEETLVQLYSKLLNVSQVDIHDHFFDLGGHSLLATQLISRLRTLLQIELPLHILFEHPTIVELAQHIELAQLQQRGTHLPPLAPTSRDQVLPLSFAQQRLWFLHQLEPNNTIYTIPIALHLKGKLQVKALIQSLSYSIARQESLRTTFPTHDGAPQQLIGPAVSANLPLIDLSALTPQTREETLHSLIQQQEAQPFQLLTGPLFRSTLLYLGPQEHVFVLTMHHIITDGWSMNILAHEISTIYQALSAQRPVPLANLPVQYADFALWQQQWLQGDELKRQLAYWRQQLQDSETLELPTDHPRPPYQTYRGARERFSIDAGLRDALQSLGRQEEVTLFMVLLSTFQILLARYSRQIDIVVGIDTANRDRQEIENIIGCFINTLVLRTDLSGNPNFKEILRRVRRVTLDAYSYQDLPFEKLVEELQPTRDLSRSPLFQVFFTYQVTNQIASLQTATSQELHFSPITIDRMVARFDLSLAVTDDGQELDCEIEYNVDLFEAATIRRLLHHWQTLLYNVVKTPEARMADLELLSEEEAQAVRRQATAGQARYQTELLLPELIAAQARQTPERITFVFQGHAITYGVLHQRAHRLANYLAAQGVGTETLVGIYLERSLDMAISMLAIFYAGGAYIPLDTSYPAARIATILNDACPALILTNTTLQRQLPEECTTHIIKLDQLSTQELTGMAERRAVRYHPDQLAYVIFTSGSTGRPKGAMITHRGMLNHLYAKIETLGIEQSERIAQTASHCFDISVWQFWAALLTGGQTHILGNAITHEPIRLLEHVHHLGISLLEVVPSLLRIWLDEIDYTGAVSTTQLTALRYLIITGESASPQLGRRWLQHSRHIPLINAYGPTECSDDVTHAIITQANTLEKRSIPIGYPIANLAIYLLDDHLKLVPPGVIGQIYVGGVGVGRGYLQHPEQTAAAFLPDPYAQQPGSRLYRTGDLGRTLPDGQIEFLGRVDHQVKLRGFRIELGEIEEVLLTHPDVRAALVTIWEESSRSQQLVAYVVSDKAAEGEGLEELLQAYLRARLPGYMLPGAFLLLDELPLTPNGKIDRKALPHPQEKNSQRQRRMPQTAAETVLAAIWMHSLGAEQVAVNDNFFEAGGHSLLATQIISRIQTIFQLEFPLNLFFTCTTIEEQVQAIAEIAGGRETIEEIAQIYQEIEALSEEELAQLPTE
ncbi:hypothetical protein KDA_39980 [Dictyobacter alpinus]|uniref:Carrier domain-containing protein n=1 Tax=Dictyobacter alpinus TaxID=2014873 RepID=A0A402BAZ6_9CHLR|nr:non-ribosomal peptide synthetase [Dictyobacter alpinus]GCE28514.1 hypothetical protein KDA_39980 [Dictyobacter alpinus]